jgi:hypothetical protein
MLVLSLGLSATARGQAETGQIAGTVTDSSGAVVVDATVTVKDVDTNAERNTKSTNTGAYQVTGLKPANYKVTVSATNFLTYSANVEVTVGGHVTLDPKLSVTAGTTAIEVVAEGGATVNTQTQELSQIVNTQQMAFLPSLTRNVYDFVTLSGNVSSGDNTTNDGMNSGQNLTARGVGYAINGQRESGSGILMDGVENVSIFNVQVGNNIPLEGVQEYSVLTNNFAAEYGRASGGVVNLTTKSGTNAIHGAAWEFNRLSAYTANTYNNDALNAAAAPCGGPKSSNPCPAPRGIYTRNQFGYSAGGPIKKDKLFIFESTEWTRVRSASSQSEEVLDPSFIAMLPANTQGYFKTYGTGGYPASGVTTTFGELAGTGLTLGKINGTKAVAASQPVFDTVNFKAPFDAGGGFPQNTYTLVGRMDYNPTDRTQMFFRGARENQDRFNGATFYSPYPQYDVGETFVNQSYLYSLNHSFSAAIFNNAKFSFTRFNQNDSFNTALTNSPNLMINPPTDPVTEGEIVLPGLENYGEPGEGGLPYGGPQNTIQIDDDLSWTKGRHSMKFGFQDTYIQLNVAYGAYAQAVEELGASMQDSLNDLMNTADNPNGSPLISFSPRVNSQGQLPCHTDIYANLLETPACAITPPVTSASYARSYRYKDWAAYLQDSFKVTPQLTLNYGLRYERYGVQHNNIASLDSNFYFGGGTGIEQQTRNGQVDIADKSPIGQFWAPRWGTFAPRLGFAYDVFGDGKTSVRGGYGISYERNFGNITFNASFNPPASAVINTVCSAANPSCAAVVTTNDLGPLGVAGPTTYLPPVEIRMPQPNINVAQTQFWSLAVQQSLARNTIVELSYSGAHGVHLYDVNNINEAGQGQVYLGDALVAGAACANTGFVNEVTGNPECLTRPNNQYSNINMRGSGGSSEYEAMNVKFQTQNIHHSGFSMVLNYTFSHSVDDISSTFSDSLQGGSGDVGSLGYTDFGNPGLDWGSSDFDVRNRVVISPIWDTPWFKSSGPLAMRETLGGWSVSGIITARGGIPFSIYDLSNVENYYTIPRLTPLTRITNYKVGKPQAAGPNIFNSLTLPVPASAAPLNPLLGMSDFGPFPTSMTHRNAFRGPGAWNFDAAASKTFKLTERVGIEFRAEGFDVPNHHNYYVNTTNLYYAGAPYTPLTVTELKGGLNSIATGGNHDERRFGQFSLKAIF